jgi:hypothetical protein
MAAESSRLLPLRYRGACHEVRQSCAHKARSFTSQPSVRCNEDNVCQNKDAKRTVEAAGRCTESHLSRSMTVLTVH